MHISGTNLLQSLSVESSYVFSNHILPPWGWATWKRAWKKYNKNLDSWQLHKKELYRLISQENFATWTDAFELVRQHRITWDISWNVDIWANSGIGIIPSVNMIKNIGFGEGATFTRYEQSRCDALFAGEMMFPLVHPSGMDTLHDKALEHAFIQLIHEINAAESRSKD